MQEPPTEVTHQEPTCCAAVFAFLPFVRLAAYFRRRRRSADFSAFRFLTGRSVKTVGYAVQVPLGAGVLSPNLGPTDSSQLINAATAGRGFHGGVTMKYRDMLVIEMGAILSVFAST